MDLILYKWMFCTRILKYRLYNMLHINYMDQIKLYLIPKYLQIQYAWSLDPLFINVPLPLAKTTLLKLIQGPKMVHRKRVNKNKASLSSLDLYLNFTKIRAFQRELLLLLFTEALEQNWSAHRNQNNQITPKLISALW